MVDDIIPAEDAIAADATTNDEAPTSSTGDESVIDDSATIDTSNDILENVEVDQFIRTPQIGGSADPADDTPETELPFASFPEDEASSSADTEQSNDVLDEADSLDEPVTELDESMSAETTNRPGGIEIVAPGEDKPTEQVSIPITESGTQNSDANSGNAVTQTSRLDDEPNIGTQNITPAESSAIEDPIALTPSNSAVNVQVDHGEGFVHVIKRIVPEATDVQAFQIYKSVESDLRKQQGTYAMADGNVGISKPGAFTLDSAIHEKIAVNGRAAANERAALNRQEQPGEVSRSNGVPFTSNEVGVNTQQRGRGANSRQVSFASPINRTINSGDFGFKQVDKVSTTEMTPPSRAGNAPATEERQSKRNNTGNSFNVGIGGDVSPPTHE